jgi:endo-1,4-beta-xylanase
MVKLFSSLLVLCSAAVAIASPFQFGNETETLERRLTLSSSSTGSSGGYYYSLWEQVNSGVSMNIGTGTYSLTWSSGSQDVVAGIGWMPGSAQ